MLEQYDIFGNLVEVKPTPKPKQSNKIKRNWENAFQRWSNEKGLYAPTEHYGKCGYGSMCDYCEDNTYGRPCVRALNEMCRIKRIAIDYKNQSFIDAWCGEFERSNNNAE